MLCSEYTQLLFFNYFAVEKFGVDLREVYYSCPITLTSKTCLVAEGDFHTVICIAQNTMRL